MTVVGGEAAMKSYDATREAGIIAQRGIASMKMFGWPPYFVAARVETQRGTVTCHLSTQIFGISLNVGVSFGGSD